MVNLIPNLKEEGVSLVRGDFPQKLISPRREIAKDSQPSPDAQALLTPQQTPSQYLNVLQEEQMGPVMVKTLAHGMPDREGVGWAAKSAEKVADKLPPDDLGAMTAAQAWVQESDSRDPGGGRGGGRENVF